MQPQQYDTWYKTQRGAWIGVEEYRLIASLLAAKQGETLLDVGCGTGYFTRLLAKNVAVENVVGTDIDLGLLRFAAAHSSRCVSYVGADARQLPFRDGSFDLLPALLHCVSFARENRGCA